MELVITVHKDGSTETLLKDKVLDLTSLGPREVKRITSIEHSTIHQQFMIKWLRGPFENRWHDYGLDSLIMDYRTSEYADHIVYYPTYEAAVEREIQCVNALRLKGHSFA